MYNENVKSELMHYGILGMKWGTSRAAKKTSGVIAAKKLKKEAYKEYSKAFTKATSPTFNKKKRCSDRQSL